MGYICSTGCPPRSAMPDWGPGPPGASMCLDYASDPLRAARACVAGAFGAVDYMSSEHVEQRTSGQASYLALRASSQAAFRQAIASYRIAGAIPFLTDGVGIPGVTAALASSSVGVGEYLVDFLSREAHAGRYVLAGEDLLALEDPAPVIVVPADRLAQVVGLPAAAGEIVVVAEPPAGKSLLGVVGAIGLGLATVAIVGSIAGWFSPSTSRSA